jgi:predicted hydrolase (HD superfamily)
MDKQSATLLMEKHLESPALRRHSLASGAVMTALAGHFAKSAEETERWAVLGIVHDLDYAETESDPALHGLKSVELLAGLGFSEEELNAIKRHNAESLGLTRETELDFALTCGEVVTGLIIAASMVQPDKKIASVKASSVVKKMKDKAFARSVNRDHIKLCEQIGLPLADFIALAIRAMADEEARLEN